jgi:hypothetical protein
MMLLPSLPVRACAQIQISHQTNCQMDKIIVMGMSHTEIMIEPQEDQNA